MSGLLDSLRSASRSLDAQRLGLDVAGQNLANVNTVGYTRRTLLLAELPPTDFYNAGRGVEVVGIYAHRDVFLDARIRREQQGEAFDAAVVDGMTSLEAAIGRPGTSLDAQLTAFFDAFANFANDVRSTAARQDVIAQGQALADGFHGVATALQTSQRDADLTLRGYVTEVNSIAAEVALLNQRIGATVGDTNALQDERGVLLSRLAELTGARLAVRERHQDAGPAVVRRAARPRAQLLDVELEPDQEHVEGETELRQDVEGRDRLLREEPGLELGRDEPEERRPEQHAGDHLGDHLRLPERPHEAADEPAGGEDHRHL